MQRIGPRVILAMPEDEITAVDLAASRHAATTGEPFSRSAYVRAAVREKLDRDMPISMRAPTPAVEAIQDFGRAFEALAHIDPAPPKDAA